MRTDFTPLFRSTVGFERLFDLLDQSSGRPDWPPYNIERTGEDRYRVTVAVAGFDPGDIEVTQQANTLLISGQRGAEQQGREMLHQGLSFRNFRHVLSLADHVKVAAAELANGLLQIELVREVPEQLKPRRIEINAPATSLAPQDNRLSLADKSGQQAQVA